MKKSLGTFLLLSFHLIALQPLSNEEQELVDSQINRNFGKYNSLGISRYMINETIGKADSWNTPSSLDPALVRIRIIDQKIYYFPGAGFDKKINILPLIRILTDTSPKLNIDFIYYNGDGLTKHVQNINHNNAPPILAGNTREGLTDYVILFDDWLTRCSDSKHYNWKMVSEDVEKNVLKYPWEARVDKLFWRGRLTDSYEYYYHNWNIFPRGHLKFLSLCYPELLDIEVIEGLHGSESRLPDWLITGSYTSAADHLKCKYQIVLDGIASQYPGFAWRLLSDSTVLKVTSKNKQWFYDFLVPWRDYVPVKEDLSDLVDMIHCLRKNDNLARKIASNGRQFALHYLNENFQLNYFLSVLLKYQSLQNFSPSLNDPEQAYFILYEET